MLYTGISGPCVPQIILLLLIMWGFGELDNQSTGRINMQKERSYFINALINLLGILNLILWSFGLAP